MKIPQQPCLQTNSNGIRFDDESNPVMQAFLHFLQTQMTGHPKLIEPVAAAELAHIAALVDGVEPD